MYQIHTTPGLVIESRMHGEAGKLISIFTRDLGLVLASAQGIRFEKSKLRYYTQDFSFAHFSLVRGKEMWRLTSAAEDLDFLCYGTMAGEKKALVARIAGILRSYLSGEEAHPELFEIVKSAFVFIDKRDISDDFVKTLESLVVFRILDALGYIGRDPEINPEIWHAPIDDALLEDVLPKRTLLNKHINKAFRESHL